MARPKKLSDDEMVRIVDSFFENSGDPGKLKCSFLEEYAMSLGIEVKAYDFRRNEAVRQRMAELRGSVQIDGGGSIAYKSIDIDAFLNRNYTREKLRNSLLELEDTWRRIYEKAVDSSERNKTLLSDVFSKKQTIDALATEKEMLETKVKSLEKTSNALPIENRYLKKMLRQHLYPAIANEILKNENVLEQVDTEVTKTAMDKLTDPALPASFSSAVAADRAMITREELLINRMREQIRKE